MIKRIYSNKDVDIQYVDLEVKRPKYIGCMNEEDKAKYELEFENKHGKSIFIYVESHLINAIVAVAPDKRGAYVTLISQKVIS